MFMLPSAFNCAIKTFLQFNLKIWNWQFECNLYIHKYISTLFQVLGEYPINITHGF